tara:strand:- start:467 stop:592 length:126 start_codon:yes stop_codon:yes gene_type:complete
VAPAFQDYLVLNEGFSTLYGTDLSKEMIDIALNKNKYKNFS